MKNFEHINAATIQSAVSFLTDWNTRIIAGGTDLLCEMKEKIIAPQRLVNIKSIPNMAYINYDETSGLKIGALTTLNEIENNDVVREKFGVLAQAAGEAASPQLRNMGTIAGNICQRPRCWYYRSANFNCLRKGGQRCFAIRGENRYHAILGGGPCHIVHPSDTAPALMASEASLRIVRAGGERIVPIGDFFVGPRDDPNRENLLKPNEIITEVQIPNPPPNFHGIFLKVRERRVWDFALVSVALIVAMEGDVCSKARIVLGGVAPVPWRVSNAEKVVEGKKIDEAVISEAAQAAVEGSKPLQQNAYKVTLAKNLVKRALTSVT